MLGEKVISDVCTGNINSALDGMDSLLSFYEGILQNLRAAQLKLQIQAQIPPELSMMISDISTYLQNLIAASLVGLQAIEIKKNALLSATSGAVAATAQAISAIVGIPASQIIGMLDLMQSDLVGQLTRGLQALGVPAELIQQAIALLNQMLQITITVPLPSFIPASIDALTAQIFVINGLISDLRTKLQASLNCML